MTRGCRHENALPHGWVNPSWDGYDGYWYEAPYLSSKQADAVVCQDCRAWLPLGPANDGGERVRVEIRAADLAHGVRNEHEFTQAEWMGWDGDEQYIMCGQHRTVWQDMSDERFVGWEAGGLARCISDHDTIHGQGET